MKENMKAWRVKARIEKYNNNKSLKAGVPDEIQELKGNMLTQQGINTLWALVAGESDSTSDGKGYVKAVGSQPAQKATPFSHAKAYIGIGDNGGSVSSPAAATDQGLKGSKRVYMQMDADYPLFGENQSITFKATFPPGIACFDWYEWTVSNGNGNDPDLWSNIQASGTAAPYDDIIRVEDKNGEGAPDPSPLGKDTDPAYPKNGLGQADIINLNHKVESMGKKYAPATWIVAVELSLA